MNNIRFWGSECAQNIKPNILACFNELTRIMLFFFYNFNPTNFIYKEYMHRWLGIYD